VARRTFPLLTCQPTCITSEHPSATVFRQPGRKPHGAFPLRRGCGPAIRRATTLPARAACRIRRFATTAPNHEEGTDGHTTTPCDGCVDARATLSGQRQFHTFAPTGRSRSTPAHLHGVTLAYETWGRLDADGGNAVLLCHAWTGDSHATGPAGHGHPAPGWWDGVVGPGLAIDTDRWFVVCVNVLGGCQGSTGPASPHPVDGLPYGSRFPVITIRDMVRAQARLADHLGVARWHSWSAARWVACRCSSGPSRSRTGCARSCPSPPVRRPRRSRSRGAPSAAGGAARPEVARRRLLRRRRRRRAVGGLSVARMVAQVTFRSDNVFTDRFGRELADGSELGDGARSVATLRGRALPRVPRRQAGPPVRHQQLPHHRQGDGPARRGPRRVAGCRRRWAA
jgi:hypothetical protein